MIKVGVSRSKNIQNLLHKVRGEPITTKIQHVLPKQKTIPTSIYPVNTNVSIMDERSMVDFIRNRISGISSPMHRADISRLYLR
ncbi:hypothetical protein D3C81_930750 [compost metagenome]